LWDCSSPAPILQYTFECNQGAVLSIVVRGETIYAGFQDGYIKVLDLETRTLVRTIIVHEVNNQLLRTNEFLTQSCRTLRFFPSPCCILIFTVCQQKAKFRWAGGCQHGTVSKTPSEMVCIIRLHGRIRRPHRQHYPVFGSNILRRIWSIPASYWSERWICQGMHQVFLFRPNTYPTQHLRCQVWNVEPPKSRDHLDGGFHRPVAQREVESTNGWRNCAHSTDST